MKSVLTPEFYQSYNPLPPYAWWAALAASLRTEMRLVGFRAVVENEDKLPKQPAIFCTNHTQRYDFMALMKALDERGQRIVTVSKAKNYHLRGTRFVIERVGVVPLASRGYFIIADFHSVHGRRPSDDEYRALRRNLDDGVALPAGAPFDDVAGRARAIAGHPFHPAQEAWRDAMERVYRTSAQESVRLLREVVAAGFHVQVYPEGTVSPRLGHGRTGAVQLAHALGIPIVPVGMSNCDAAFTAFVPRGQTVTLRVGDPISVEDLRLPRDHRAFFAEDERKHAAALETATERIMVALDGLVDERYRRAPAQSAARPGARATSRGVAAHI